MDPELPATPAPPPPPATPLTQLPSISEGEMAAALAQGAPKATAAPAAAPVSGDSPWAALRDPHGNPFDPELHLTDQAGTPAMSKGGRLMAKPGMGPTCKARALAARAKAAGGPTGAKPSAGPALHLDEVEPEEEEEEEDIEEEDPPRSAAEIDERAQMDAETVADTEEIVLDLLMPGELTPKERARLEQTAKRVMQQDGIELPFGAKALHSLELMRVFNRRAKTPEGQASLGRLGQFVRDIIQQLKERASK